MAWGAMAGAATSYLLPQLFGSNQPSGNTTTTTTPWSGQQPYLLGGKQPDGTNLAGGFTGAQQWLNGGGTQYAGMNDVQNQAGNNLINLNQTGNNGLQGNSTNALNQFTSGSMLNSNPYLSSMVGAADNSITRAYQNAVQPGLQSNAEANGRYGSGAMANQQSQAQQDLATQLGNTNANLYGNAYQQGMGNMLQAAGMAPNANASAVSLANAQLGFGGLQQANTNAQNQQPLTNLQNYQGLISGNYGGTTTNPYFTNNAATLLGGAALGSQIYNNYQNQNPSTNADLMLSSGGTSDPRAKENIKYAGKTVHNLNLYEFNYIGGNRKFIGVMSNEVEKILPEAVIKGGEFDRVDYKMLGIEMTEV